MMSLTRAEADLARARSESAKLKLQLQASELRVVKLENFIEMARVYLADDASEAEPQKPATAGSPLVPVCIELIRQCGSRMSTRTLVAELEKRGFAIGGQNKITNLSGALSRSHDLTASRAEGWGLKEWDSDTQEERQFRALGVTITGMTVADESEAGVTIGPSYMIDNDDSF